MSTETAKAPTPVLKELDKLANSRLLSEFSRTSGVSLSTLVNAKSGKPIAQDTLNSIMLGMEKRRRTLIPDVGIALPEPTLSESLSRARLHAGIVHLVAHLSDLLQTDRTQKIRISELEAQLLTQQNRVAELQVLVSKNHTAPAEVLPARDALAEVAQAAGPRHADLMRSLADRLPKAPAASTSELQLA